MPLSASDERSRALELATGEEWDEVRVDASFVISDGDGENIMQFTGGEGIHKRALAVRVPSPRAMPRVHACAPSRPWLRAACEVKRVRALARTTAQWRACGTPRGRGSL